MAAVQTRAAPLLIALVALAAAAHAHTYHMGSCPKVPPMPNFNMNRFLGRWHVLEKTSTRVRCLTNEYSLPGGSVAGEKAAKATRPTEWEDEEVDNAREWRLVQRMQLPLPAVNNGVRYNGRITAGDASRPGAMTVRFPLNVMGSSSYVVFDTDYDTYAGVYSCQNIAFWHRHSASIMAREDTLSAELLGKLRRQLSALGIEVRDLDRIRHACPDDADEQGIQVNIRPGVFRTNATDILVDAGDVAASAADAARRAYDVYNTVNTVYTGLQGAARRRRQASNADADPDADSDEAGDDDSDARRTEDVDTFNNAIADLTVDWMP